MNCVSVAPILIIILAGAGLYRLFFGGVQVLA
jgi:hypothetical protein